MAFGARGYMICHSQIELQCVGVGSDFIYVYVCVCVYTLYKLTFLYMLYTYKIYLFFSGVCLLYLGLGFTIAVSFECIPSGLHFEVNTKLQL